jgi:hypothetical protein
VSKATRFGALTVLVAALLGVVSAAAATTLTFDELPFQPIDGLSFEGVTFGFTVGAANSTEAYYNSYGPGAIATIQDPSLTGDSAGIVTLDFDLPTRLLQFGAALNTGDPLTPGFSVELFDASLHSLGVTPVDTLPAAGAFGFSEALFDYSGTPVLRAVIDFAHEPGSFALDNLTYVPEPATLTLVLLATLALAGGRFVPFSRSGG